MFTGPPGRLLSFSVDVALAVPLLIAYGARRAWQTLPPGRRAASKEPPRDQSSAA
jgi:hypothetical protein